jgi:predicted amidohydrolase YtcJ
MTFIFNHTTRPHGVIDAVKATFSRLLLICILPSSTIIAQEADIILIHGKIFTSDTNHLYVQALAIQGDKIMATGTDEEILKLAGDRTPTIDLKGKTVVPGFNDAHAHIGATYPAYRFELSANPLAQTPWKTIRDSLSRIVKRIQPGTFIITPIHPIY